MPGTVRKIIDRIKEQRSGGNSVVALTVETRLVLQGFDPQRFDYETPDDPGRLARIQQIAGEMSVDIEDLLHDADVAPDPESDPAPAPGSPLQSSGGEGVAAAAQAAAAAAGVTAAGGQRASMPAVPDDHPLRGFKEIADTTLAQLGEDAGVGAQSGVAFSTLIKSSLLIGLYSFTSDRIFLDQLRYNTLFQWFLDLAPTETQFDPETFAADRERALDSQPARRIFDRLVPKAGQKRLFSSELLQANGRQIKSWMSQRAGA